ncbi:hypothetical protein DE146DRAFT_602329, partial [Phaeosphaeria sp. MPI-PUGE-AT-0046c]
TLYSMAESDSDEGSYAINAIRAERWNSQPPNPDPPRMEYLIEWEGYAMHNLLPHFLQCSSYVGSFEPDYALKDAGKDADKGVGIVEKWNRQKSKMTQKLFQAFNEENETRHQIVYAESKLGPEEHKKRSGRLENRRQRGRRVVEDDDSEDDDTSTKLSPTTSNQPQVKHANKTLASSQELHKDLFVDSQDSNPLSHPAPIGQPNDGLFIGPHALARAAPFHQSDEDEYSATDSSSESSEGKPSSQHKASAKTSPQANRGRDLGNSILSPKGETQINQSSSSSSLLVAATTVARDSDVAKQRFPATSDPAPSVASLSKPASVESANRAVERRTGLSLTSSDPIRITNDPNTPKRKQWESDKHFSTLKFRRNAEVRARTEGNPDISALEFVGSTPSNLPKPKPTAPSDNVYGRREVRPRRMQEDSDEEDSRRRPDPMTDWEANKVPLVCYHWRLSNNCSYPASKCNFLHRNTDEKGRALAIGDENGYIPPKYRKPPVTCLYWLENPNGCSKTDRDCAFTHRNTGWKLLEGNKGEAVQIDPSLPPITERAISGHISPNRTDPAVTPVSVHKENLPIIPRTNPNNWQDKTCCYWANGHCSKSDDQCTFRHYITDVVADLGPILPQARMSSLITKREIEVALKTEFTALFEWSDDGSDRVMLERRALLIFHPVDHQEELELLTRWLLMHHVEVSNAWFPGAWPYYKQRIIAGGSGIVIVLRLWSLGVQPNIEHDPAALNCPNEMSLDCIEIFPVGGLMYITENVFEEKPQLALEIIRLFCAKIDGLHRLIGSKGSWQDVQEISLRWRLCARPELLEYLFRRCEDQEEELEAGEANALARAELYALLSDHKLIEQDTIVHSLETKCDRFPIMSERRIIAEGEPLDYFNAIAHSPEEANARMIQYYGCMHIDMRRDYRHFYVVHTDHLAPCATRWKRENQVLTDVITPEQCIAELSKDGHDPEVRSTFDFYERYLMEPSRE